MEESKAQKFDRLAKSRKERLIREIRLISNLSNTKNYVYSENDVEELFSEVEKELFLARAKFRENL